MKKLTPVQAFEAADRIQHAYHTGLESEASVNATLLDILGVEGYKKFCEEFRKLQPRKDVPKDSWCHFKESFIENQNWHKNLMYNGHVRYFWGLSSIMNTVKLLLQ